MIFIIVMIIIVIIIFLWCCLWKVPGNLIRLKTITADDLA